MTPSRSTKARVTAAVGLVGVAVGLWLALVPYQRTIRLARIELSGRCPPAVTAAFVRVRPPVIYDLGGPGGGNGLPAELCRRSARQRLAGGVAVSLLAAAVAVGGRTTWPVRPGDV